MTQSVDDLPSDGAAAPTSSIRAVERAARVILAFTDEESLGVRDLARTLDVPKSVVHRILETLASTGLLERDDDAGRYRLGSGAAELGLRALRSADLPTRALPLLSELRSATNETAGLSVVSGNFRVDISQLESSQPVKMRLEIGIRRPLYAGSPGLAMLSTFDDERLAKFLKEVPLERLTPHSITDERVLRERLATFRAQGFAYSLGEVDAAAGGVAAPFFRGRSVQGALLVCGPVTRFQDTATIDHYGELVRRAARHLGSPSPFTA
jgi:IclR family acetate operon transcriptional repressor